jgi:hypothetical protein
MSLVDVLRINIVGFLFPDNGGDLPDSFFIVALGLIIVSALIMKWRNPEMGDKGLTDYL